jgi:hypothetical protein
MTGFGRTGRALASEIWQVQADIAIVGKAMRQIVSGLSGKMSVIGSFPWEARPRGACAGALPFSVSSTSIVACIHPGLGALGQLDGDGSAIQFAEHSP